MRELKKIAKEINKYSSKNDAKGLHNTLKKACGNNRQTDIKGLIDKNKKMQCNTEKNWTSSDKNGITTVNLQATLKILSIPTYAHRQIRYVI